MKLAICYPPLENKKGEPLLGQNRQFQWFKIPTFIYPVVPAYAATMLKKAGHGVAWLDGIAEGWSYQQWLARLRKEAPDLIIIETKTPVIKQHWEIINNLKSQMTNSKCVLVGDHVTALPKESFRESKVDYVLTGGDYDFLLLNLVNHLLKKEKLEPGVWYRQQGKIKNTGHFRLNHDLNQLPFIDRELTKWRLYAYQNGNYKRTPGTYIMSGRDCWWGKCQFCAWTILYPQYRTRKTEDVLAEIGELIDRYKVKEIMDDTGTFPVGKWLENFCLGMITKGYYKKINFDCNLRFGVLTEKQYRLMAQAGFRLLLFGVESANQKTLDRLNKGISVNRIKEELRMIKKVGGRLEPHLTFMVGYPWETRKETEKTLRLAKELFAKGLISSLQATIMIPYPGTKLFTEAKKKGWLKTENWEDYDMSKPVLKTKIAPGELKNLTQKLYLSFGSPSAVVRRLLAIRGWEDVKYIFQGGRRALGHWFNFKNEIK